MKTFRKLLLAASLPALPLAAQDLREQTIIPPPEVMEFAEENAGVCREVGGNPVFRPEFLTVTDLNGDGEQDYVAWVAGITCEGAYSALGGSAGHVAQVWMSTPDGLHLAWQNYAQDLKVEGREVVIWQHGAFCDPPRTGADGCEVRLRY